MQPKIMADVWDKFSLEEKKALCTAFAVPLYGGQPKYISIGALALFELSKVRAAVAKTSFSDTLGLAAQSDAMRLLYKLDGLQ